MHFCYLLPNSVSKGNYVFGTDKYFFYFFIKAAPNYEIIIALFSVFLES